MRIYPEKVSKEYSRAKQNAYCKNQKALPLPAFQASPFYYDPQQKICEYRNAQDTQKARIRQEIVYINQILKEYPKIFDEMRE